MDEKYFQQQWHNASPVQLTNWLPVGCNIEIVHKGILNHDSGPDYLNAVVKMNGVEWHGNIELHLRNSDWYLHGHHLDPAYNTVVLHVVLHGEGNVYNQRGEPICTVRVAGAESWSPGPDISVPTSRILEHFGTEVMLLRMQEVIQLYYKFRGNFHQTLFVWLGMSALRPQNDIPCLQALQMLSVSDIVRRPYVVRCSAIMYAAGFFNRVPQIHKTTSALLCMGEPVLSHQWKYHRMRPANYPFTRLAQFAVLLDAWHLIHNMVHKAASELSGLISVLSSLRYAEYGVAQPGSSWIYRIMLNGLIPAMMAYHCLQGNSSILQHWKMIAESLPPEDNRVTRAWRKHGVISGNAMQSQGLISWQNQYGITGFQYECNEAREEYRVEKLTLA